MQRQASQFRVKLLFGEMNEMNTQNCKLSRNEPHPLTTMIKSILYKTARLSSLGYLYTYIDRLDSFVK